MLKLLVMMLALARTSRALVARASRPRVTARREEVHERRTTNDELRGRRRFRSEPPATITLPGEDAEDGRV